MRTQKAELSSMEFALICLYRKKVDTQRLSNKTVLRKNQTNTKHEFLGTLLCNVSILLWHL